MNLITKDDKHPQALIIASLEVLSLSITRSFPPASPQEEISSQVQETASKLEVALSRIFNHLLSHPSIQVRLALIKFVEELFFKCDAMLVKFLAEKIVDVPLTFSCDEDVDIRSAASSSLILIFKYCHMTTSVQDAIVTKLLMTCKNLRQNIDSLSSQEKLIHFKFLTGIFSSFQHNSQTFLQVPKNRNDVMRTLIHVCKFEKSSLLDYGALGQESCPFNFKFLKSREEVDAFKELVRSVSTGCNKHMLIDFLIDNLKKTRFEEHLAFIALEMLKDFDCDFSGDLLEVIKSRLEEDVLKYPIITPRLLLAIEGVKISSSKLGVAKESTLLPIIYTLLKLEKKEVHLSVISRQLGYRNVDEIICKNRLYFCEKFREEMNVIHLIGCSLVLFCNLIQEPLCNESFSELEGVVDTLLQILDLNYNNSAEIPLQMLALFAKLVSKQFSEVIRNKEYPVREKSGSFCFKSSWSEYLNTVDILETDPLSLEGNGVTGQENENHMSDPEKEDDTSEKKELPVHVKIIKKVCERSVNLLTLPEADHRALVLDIISHCITILSTEENDLLPLVHKMWSSLVNRLQDELHVASKAFQLVLQLSTVCGDFVYRRITSDVFPKMFSFLQNHVSDGVKSKSRHPFTLVYRLQLEAIIGISILAVGIAARGRTLWGLINILLPYYNQNQPTALMDAAEKSLMLLKSVDPDAFWFNCKKFVAIQSPNSYKIPFEKLNECSL